MVAPALLPNSAAAFVDANGRATQEFRDFLIKLTSSTDTALLQSEIDALAAQVQELADAGGNTATIAGIGSINVSGSIEDGYVQITLQGDNQNLSEPTWVYGTDQTGQRGFYRLFDGMEAGVGLEVTSSAYLIDGDVGTPADLPVSGTVGHAYFVSGPAGSQGTWYWDGAAWTLDPAATGVVGYRLALLADTGIGTFKLLTRDAYGRLEGTLDGDTDDVPEGATNLYFTDQRAQDAVGTIFVDSAGIEWAYDGTGHTITATLSSAVNASLALADTALQDAPSDGSTYGRKDGAWAAVTGGGSGTVTSVAATGSTGLTVGDSPITTSGTLTFTLSANLQSWSGIAPSSKADDSGVVHTTGDETVGGLKTFTSVLTTKDDINLDLSGAATNADFSIYADAGSVARTQLFGGASGNSLRWWYGRNQIAESGSDSGSNFVINRYSDAGSFLGTVLEINRATGVAILQATPTFPTASVSDNSTNGATTQFVKGHAYSGTYTPTLTNTTNISSSTAYPCQYMVVGNVVTVSGIVDVTCSANSTNTELRMSLPVTSGNFANSSECGGVANPGEVVGAGSAAGIQALVSGTVARMRYASGTSSTSSRSWRFTLTYKII